MMNTYSVFQDVINGEMFIPLRLHMVSQLKRRREIL